jgi:hypothetical protein
MHKKHKRPSIKMKNRPIPAHNVYESELATFYCTVIRQLPVCTIQQFKPAGAKPEWKNREADVDREELE